MEKTLGRAIRERLETLACWLAVPVGIIVVSAGVQTFSKYQHFIPGMQDVPSYSPSECPGCILVHRFDGSEDYVHVGREIAGRFREVNQPTPPKSVLQQASISGDNRCER